MESLPLLEQGLALMLYGMGTVFLFLTLLVASAALMSVLVRRITPAPPALPASTVTPAAPLARDAELVAAIGAAIHRHRSHPPR